MCPIKRKHNPHSNLYMHKVTKPTPQCQRPKTAKGAAPESVKTDEMCFMPLVFLELVEQGSACSMCPVV